MIDKELLQILACPNCKEKLFYSVSENKLKCNFENLDFSVNDNIPILKDNEVKYSDKD